MSGVCWTCGGAAPGVSLAVLRSCHTSEADLVKYCLDVYIDDTMASTVCFCDRCCSKLKSFYKFKLLANKLIACLLNSHQNLKEEESEIYTIKAEFNTDLEYLVQSGYNDEVQSDSGGVDDTSREDPMQSEVKLEIDSVDENFFDDRNDELLTVLNPNNNKDTDKVVLIKKKCRQPRIDKSVSPTKKKPGRPKLNKPKIKEKSVSKVCDVCGATVACLRTHLMGHLPASERKRIPCKFCDKTFCGYSSRGRHIRNKHLCVQQTCPKCNKSVKDLAAHDLRTHNRDLLPVQCRVCPQRYATHALLALHMSVHTQSRQHVCPDCGATFRLKMSMQRHKRRVHEKEKSYMCDYCSKDFFSKYTLIIHLRMHTDERPQRCGECGKRFRTREQLKVHLLRHRGQRDYPCTLCSMACHTAGALRVHMISHTKEKHHKCAYCEVSFGRTDHRNRHQRTAHPKQLQAANTTQSKCDTDQRVELAL